MTMGYPSGFQPQPTPSYQTPFRAGPGASSYRNMTPVTPRPSSSAAMTRPPIPQSFQRALPANVLQEAYPSSKAKTTAELWNTTWFDLGTLALGAATLISWLTPFKTVRSLLFKSLVVMTGASIASMVIPPLKSLGQMGLSPVLDKITDMIRQQ